MSYFSQKKKQKRINVLLTSSLLLVAVVLLVGLIFSSTTFSHIVDNYRFHIYLFTIAVMFFALFYRKTGFAIVAMCLLLFNYTIISSSTNLFFDVLVKGTETLHLQYHKNKTSFPEIISALDISSARKGTLRLSENNQAAFIIFRRYNRRFVAVSVDLSELNSKEQKTALNNLSEFVLKQDDPVLLVGNFGVPAWASLFKDFLQKTALEVKNRVLLTNGESLFSPFSVPSINLLAYKNIGIRNINFTRSNDTSPLIINFNLEYN